ncbi:MAG: putative unusual protein kinase regulating ubiquinone biosynthesis (AarF/ABC1/UbiB family) [Myxococcota bacterium]|jgi:predicted unusual protein kinase regulating ubiquinone biosynthesis (AarF/ABC1/UbiB family)
MAKLGTLGGKVGARWVQDRVNGAMGRAETARDKVRARTATDIAETLGTLKGAAMKAGQQLAMAAQHMDLPDEVKAPLAKLHKDAEPIPFDRIREVVEAELEGTLDTLFSSFDRIPIGTASLAQAHAATLPDGTAVVIKVLHDGVLDGLDADLLALKALLQSGRLFGRPKNEINGLYNEIEARLREELDYFQEAANIADFQRVYGSDPRVRIPHTHPKYSTERVLTMDHLPGVSLDEFAKTASPEIKQKVGLTLAELFLEMTFEHRLLHADPHPGNYLFEPDGRIGMIDFGCVKRFDEFFIGTYSSVALNAFNGEREACLQSCRDIGAWKGDNPRAGELIWEFCQAIVAPFQTGPLLLGGPRDTVVEDASAVGKQLWKFNEIGGSSSMVFLHRTLGGLYTLARSLDVEADFKPMLLESFGRAVARAEGTLVE